MNSIFHLAFPVSDLAATKDFYTNVLGCKIGRTGPNWVDVDFFGNQLTMHEQSSVQVEIFRPNESKLFPDTHFGLALNTQQWNEVLSRLKERNVSFVIEPASYFEGMAGEQRLFIIQDPSGYYIEFKTFSDLNNIFKQD